MPGGQELESGRVEGFVMTAAGCGAQVREYAALLKHDPAYTDKAARIAAMTRDASEVLAAEQPRLLELLRKARAGVGKRVAFHSPCTLQHAQKIRGVVEALLTAAGYQLSPVADAHLCCGSAGTYSITQPVLARQLRDQKLAALHAGSPDLLVTANVGCQMHSAKRQHAAGAALDRTDRRAFARRLLKRTDHQTRTGRRAMFIDRQASSYDALCRSFRWQLPERFNIGVDLCGRWAEDRSRFALYYEDESGFSSAHTFWDIQRQANRLSNVLAALGTLPGDRVALILPQCPEAAIAHVAIYQMGALAVPLSPLCTPDALAYRLGDAGAHLAIVDATTLPTLRQLRDKLPQLQHLLGVGAVAGQDLKRWEEVLEHASPRYTPQRPRPMIRR
jgi:hypothetical protein